MDIKLFKLDIDELINEFTQSELNSFAEFKRVWLSRKFSYIFEASPSTNQGLFMQSLYAHSIRELKQLKNLVFDAKAAGVKVVAALMKSMLERNMFLFGFVGDNEGSATERVNELTDVQNACVQSAYNKLLANSRLEHFIHMDLDKELDVDVFKKRSSDYAAAKELAIKEASHVVDVENIKHIAENQRSIGDVVEKTAADWKSQKELLYQQTGVSRLAVAVPPHQEDGENPNGNKKRKAAAPDDLGRPEGMDNLEDEQENPEEFCKELEETLLFEPLKSDYEEVEASEEYA